MSSKAALMLDILKEERYPQSTVPIKYFQEYDWLVNVTDADGNPRWGCILRFMHNLHSTFDLGDIQRFRNAILKV